MKPQTPSLAVDTVILFKNRLVLVKRKNPPYQGKFALPGGFVEIGETTEKAAAREAFEETGLSVELIKLVGVYSDPDRDPRGHTVSVCYLAKGFGELRSGSDADSVDLFKLDSVPELAFDHNKIINDAKKVILMQFCPKCKSMMFPKNGNFECRKCGNIIPIKSDEKSFVSRAKIDDHEIVVLEGEQTSGLPTTSAKCPECGNNTAAWWLRQLRSADESETRFFKCTKCGFTWREYD